MGIEAGIPFGSYTLLKRIARGGMAEVFVARQSGMDGFDRMVAIKRILPHLLDDGSHVRMFQDEARIAARLSHPNVVHIYDFGKVGDHFFIAMEYMHAVHAGDLIRLAEQCPLPPALVARIGANACAGLHYAHNRTDDKGQPLKIVHRDVSPPNLLISYDGVVKLVDFGIAKAVNSIEQTRPGVVKGKYAFMSPEQTMGQPLDGRSDVFSLALVLWELLAGTYAVPRDDQILAMQMIRDGKVPPIESVRKDVPPLLASAMSHALRKNPKKRSDAREFGRGLEAFIKSSKEVATNMELGTWLTEGLPPTPISHVDEKDPGTRRATVATSLQPLLPELDNSSPVVPASADASHIDGEHDSADMPGVAMGEFSQDTPLPAPKSNEDSVVIARSMVDSGLEQKTRDIRSGNCGEEHALTVDEYSATREDTTQAEIEIEEATDDRTIEDHTSILRALDQGEQSDESQIATSPLPKSKRGFSMTHRAHWAPWAAALIAILGIGAALVLRDAPTRRAQPTTAAAPTDAGVLRLPFVVTALPDAGAAQPSKVIPVVAPMAPPPTE